MKKAGVNFLFAVIGFGAAFVWAHFARMPKYDLDLPPQDVRIYAKKSAASVAALPQTFREKYFAPWTDADLPDISTAFAMPDELKTKDYYDGRGKRHSREFIDSVIANAKGGREIPPTKGIVIMDADLRAVPSDARFYEAPSDPTFGWPFDMAIYSRLRANTPVALRMISKDERWIAAWSFAGGTWWIKADAVRFVADAEVKTFMKSKIMTPVVEPLFAKNRDRLFVGTLLPVINGAPARATEHGWEAVPSDWLAEWPLPFSHEKAAEIAQIMQGPYAWGGIEGTGRDCSQLIQEMFAPFGLFVPRNTKGQAERFKGVDLSEMESQDKAAAIVQNAVPFETLLYMPGHVMLYVGTDADGNPAAYHALWGQKVRTQFLQETRNVVGKTIVSGLDLGSPSWLDRMQKILFLREDGD